MSASNFSSVLAKNLLQKLGRTLQTNIDSITTKVKRDALDKTPESIRDLARSTGGIRLLTDSNQQGIVTRNGLQTLSVRFNDAINNPRLLKTIARDLDPKWKNITIDFLVKKYVWIQTDKANLVKFLTETARERTALPRGKTLKDEMPGGNAFQKAGIYLDKFNRVFTDIIGELSRETSSIFSNPLTYDNFVKFLSGKNLADFNPSLNNNSGASFKGIHRDINKYFKEYLISSGTPAYLAEFIDINIDAGHLLGMFSEQLAFATGGKIYVSNKGPNDIVPKVELEVFPLSAGPITQEQQRINKIFSELMELTANADLISSSFIQDIQIFADSTKNIASANNEANFLKFLAAVEMQLGKDNSLGGSILSQISARMSSLIDKADSYIRQGAGQESLDKLEKEAAEDLAAIFNSTKSIANYISNLSKEMVKRDIYAPAQKLVIEYLEKNSRDLADTLINTAGSDPIKLSIKKYLISSLDPTQPYKPANPITRATSKSSIAGVKARSKLSTPKTQVKPATKTKSTNKFVVNKTTLSVQRRIRPLTSSLPNLLNQINGLLQQQIRRNMGTGNSRNVLNYRTGRFAESVKVERLSESRQGMITAFYSYMKNPYATFSEGGRQQYPRSRDPKTLISKSIREVAQTMVTNQLRAVNV